MVLGRAKGGIEYSKLTNKQKEAVSKFYDRPLVKEEKRYRYFFDASGKCISAT